MSVTPCSEPTATVVVPTYARPRQLAECLEALACQTLPTSQFEVLVVDDGGPEPLDGIVAPFTSRLSVRLVRQENAGPAAARNRGVKAAAASLIAFTDDDCRPMPDWLEELVAAARRHPRALVGGTTFNGLRDDILAETTQLILDLVCAHFNADPDAAYFFASNNMLCSREQLIALGGFDAGFTRAGAEDRDFCDRWRAAGLPLVWRPEARSEHRHGQNLRTFIDLHYRYGRGAYLYHAKRRRRRTGTMQEDLGFHATLPRRVWQRLSGQKGFFRRLRIAAALCLWQVVNFVGFAAQAWADRRQPRHG